MERKECAYRGWEEEEEKESVARGCGKRRDPSASILRIGVEEHPLNAGLMVDAS